jgi:tetratricopeptide (TPR) repeat protein
MSLTADFSNAREHLLDEVLANHLKAVQEGQAPSRQALLDSYPELAGELAEFFADQDHVERLAAPLRAIAPAPSLAAGTVLGDYEILDEIAQGGMGIVYRARQKSLQRLVALKVLQAGPLASPEQWQRFQTEAEAVAGLDHPHIVPVYEVGVRDNVPYFSMKLLEGGNLAHRLAGGDRPSCREAAQLLATIADAVHYAHERGILHRDLKPANILLDAQGQPHVSDFGLAKRAVGSGGNGVTTVRCDATPLPPLALTISGAIVGTPSYMAPEQAAGSRALTTATDVYGLGTILYELLTGRPPFRGEHLLDTLRRLQEEEPPAPRSVQAGVDRDLETICLKCLQKEPSRRYASARELALDLRRYLAGEPIEARRVGRVERLWLWCRRKPFIAGMTLAFVVVISVVIATAFVLVERKHHETTVANRNLAASRDKGRQIIDDFCRQLSEDGWGDDPALQERRKQLLEKGLAYCRDFLDDPNAETPVSRELVRTYFRIGDITAVLGKREEARDAFNRALAAADILLQIEPGDRDVRLILARTYNRLGMLDRKNGRENDNDALQSYRKAHELLAVLRREEPEDLNAEGEQSVACNNLGALYADLGRLDEAAVSYRECIDLNRALARRSTDWQYPYALAISLQNYGLLVFRKGRRDEAWDCFRESEKLSRRVAAERPNVPRYQQQLGHILLNRGCKECDEKRFDDAIKTLTEGREVLTGLIKMQPGSWWFKKDLARLLNQLARAHRDLGKTNTKNTSTHRDEAIQAFQAAGKLYKELFTHDPGATDFLHRRASCAFEAGLLLGEQGKTAEAIRSYQETRDIGRQLVKSFPDSLKYQNQLGLALNNLGRKLWRLERHDEALTALREALTPNRLAFDRSSRRSYHRGVLNNTYLFLSDVYRDTGRHKEWAAMLLQRRELWPDNNSELFVIACELAQAKDDDEAMRTLEQAIRKGFKDFPRLEKEAALTSLRQRPDFAKLFPRSKASN